MASEKKLEQVLDLLTKAPPSQVESLGVAARDDTRSIRKVIGTKNVVAIGISEKITKRRPTGKLALTFYVNKKMPLKELSAEEAIPPTVPEALSGPGAIPTDVIVLGELKPEVNVSRKLIQPGNSIGHVDITAGTLGAIVTKGKSYYLLSNSHVLAVSGTAKNGDSILYPGKADGGDLPDSLVAKLSGFKKFNGGGDFVNRVDCAIAKPVAARLGDLTSEVKGLGVPRGTLKAKRGMKVVKVGRTSGKTTGEVRDVNFRFVLDYDEDGLHEVGFVDQVLCTRFTKPGDSGSLVIDQKTGKAVGLHFAGANGGSVFNPIGEVLAALGVKLVTKPIVLAPGNGKKDIPEPGHKPKETCPPEDDRQEDQEKLVKEIDPMATERAANLAREQYSGDLHNLGAHAIAVDQVQRKGEKTFAVVAFFEEKPDKVPNVLKVKIGNRTLDVPLVARVFEKFKPE